MKKKSKVWKRNCPNCEAVVTHMNKTSYKQAVMHDRLCVSCGAKKRFGTLGLHNPKLWKSPCKRCGEIREYTHIKSWKQRRDLCVSCSQIKNDEHYNRKFQRYRGKVWTITNKQNLETLEHIEKRGKNGVDGAYQLDHIISIKEGFDKNIDPEIIGNIDNLQMLPWLENRKKG